MFFFRALKSLGIYLPFLAKMTPVLVCFTFYLFGTHSSNTMHIFFGERRTRRFQIPSDKNISIAFSDIVQNKMRRPPRDRFISTHKCGMMGWKCGAKKNRRLLWHFWLLGICPADTPANLCLYRKLRKYHLFFVTGGQFLFTILKKWVCFHLFLIKT